MTDPQERAPGPDDTAAFQRFYGGDRGQETRRGLLYRFLIGWWRDRG